MSPDAASALLRSRLCEHQTQAARAQGFRPASGKRPIREEASVDDASSPASSVRRLQGGVAAPSAWRFGEWESTPSRRDGDAVSNNDSDTKSGTLRELDERIDRLSKENFDLKLDIFHRRQKIEKLELELESMHALRAEQTDLLSLNEDLVKELELRDRAVDEAVVRIYDLEQYTDALEQRVAELRGSAFQQQYECEHAQPSTTAQRPRPMRDPVSPRRIPARSSDSMGGAYGLPKSLSGRDPLTATLRHIFVSGDRPVRPMPSHASLLDHQDEGDETRTAGDPHQVLRSPILSDTSDDATPAASPFLGPTRSQHISPALLVGKETPTQEVHARVSCWVAEGAISPASRSGADSSSNGRSDLLPFEQAPERPFGHLQPALQTTIRDDMHTRAQDVLGARGFDPVVLVQSQEDVERSSPGATLGHMPTGLGAFLKSTKHAQSWDLRALSRSQFQQSPKQETPVTPEQQSAATPISSRNSRSAPQLGGQTLRRPLDITALKESSRQATTPDGMTLESPVKKARGHTDHAQPLQKIARVDARTIGRSGSQAGVHEKSSRSYAGRRLSSDTVLQLSLASMPVPRSSRGYTDGQPRCNSMPKSTDYGSTVNAPHAFGHGRAALYSVDSGIPLVPFGSPASPETDGTPSRRSDTLRQCIGKVARHNSLASVTSSSTARTRSVRLMQRHGLRRNERNESIAPREGLRVGFV